MLLFCFHIWAGTIWDEVIPCLFLTFSPWELAKTVLKFVFNLNFSQPVKNILKYEPLD